MTSASLFKDAVVIFDLDGTLIDSAPDLTGALNHVLARLDLAPADPDEVRPLVGQGVKALLERGLAQHGHPLPDGDEFERLRTLFIDHYRAHIADGTYIFDGVEACLDDLAARGAELAICTNKPEDLALDVVGKLDLKRRFAEILGGGSLAENKPSPLPLQEIKARTGRRFGVMVGDTLTDLAAARAAGMPCAFATFGYGDPETPLHKHEQRFDGFEALSGVVGSLLAQRAGSEA